VMQPHQDHRGQMTETLGWEISRQEARAYLEHRREETAQAVGRTVEMRLEQGHPAERIVGVAREIGADLTVLGSHGEAGVAAWTLGSTVQQVLSVTRGSVLLARSGASVSSVAIPKRILVPLDGSLRTESVLPTAARIANTFGAEVLLVHVVQEPVASSVLSSDEDLELAKDLAARLEARAASYLDIMHDRLVNEVPAVRTLVVRHANERQGLLDISQREQIDLVVLSAHGVACDPTLTFGSVTAHLLTHSAVPILALQDLRNELERPVDVGAPVAPPLRARFPPEAV
jgi:nucleotide-binding universal stress UspA family protein